MTAPFDLMKPRPTLYRGIWMRSRLEAWFAGWLDRQNFIWKYEPDCFAAPSGQYVPDFRVSDHAPKDWLEREGSASLYVEIKPAANMADPLELAHIIWESKPTAHLLYASPDLFQPRYLHTRAPLVAGTTREIDTALVFSCKQCGRTTLAASSGSWECRWCGACDHHYQPLDDSPWYQQQAA